MIHNPEVVYYEDASFASISTEEGKQKAREWRYFLERRFGLYNADVHHVCDIHCFDQEIFAPLPTMQVVTEKMRKREEQLRRKRDEAGPNLQYVHAIDRRLGLHGCPRSGLIHQCAFNKAMRAETCKIVYASEINAVLCRFSGWEVHAPEKIEGYNPYRDDNLEFKTKIYSNTRVEDSMRRARVIFEAKQIQAKETEDAQKGRFDAPSMKATTKALRHLRLRSSGSPKRTYEMASSSDDSSTSSFENEQLEPPRKRPTPPSSPNLTPRCGAISSKDVPLVEHYSVPIETYNRIKRAVTEILFDAHVYEDFRSHYATLDATHGISPALVTLDTPKEEVEMRKKFYIQRIALMYAIVREEQIRRFPEAATASPYASTSSPGKRRRFGSARRTAGRKVPEQAAKIEAKKFAVAAIYLLGTGVASGTNSILAPDESVRASIPMETDLIWYGIEEGTRRAYLRAGTRPNAKKIKYQFVRKIYQRIQMFIGEFEPGEEVLRRLLASGFS